MRRLWRAFRFALKAFRFSLIYGNVHLVPNQRDRIPSTTTDHPSSAAFCVVLEGGMVLYEGEEGSKARICIEGLRAKKEEWKAYRGGSLWDWGPR